MADGRAEKEIHEHLINAEKRSDIRRMKKVNLVILIGRLTRNPEIRYSQGEKSTAVARYTLAVDRTYRREGENNADFIGCVAFGRSAEFAEKYFRQGTKIAITGRIQTGSYVNREGKKIYTTNVMVDAQEFAGSRDGYQESAPKGQPMPEVDKDGFMNIPDGIDDELPFE